MAEKIVIERTDAEQQFHVRFVAGNGKRTFWCENLKTRASAIKAIKRHAATFQVKGSTPPVVVAAPLLASGLALRVYQGPMRGSAVREDYLDIEIENRDSRYVPFAQRA
jgi:uncharacterized protein YegP (UPF0339 family)